MSQQNTWGGQAPPYGYPSSQPSGYGASPSQPLGYGAPPSQPPGYGTASPQQYQQAPSSYGSQTISVRIVSARDLKNMDVVGKQDPYVSLSVSVDGSHSVRSFTQKQGGTEPNWNQELQIETHGAPELYVDIYDEDLTNDDLISFCAIPLSQIPIDGWFQTFMADGKPKGEIHLIILPSSYSGQTLPQVKGTSGLNPQHQKRVTSKQKKGMLTSVGGGILGLGLVAGAAYLGEQYLEKHEEGEKKHLEGEQQRKLREEQLRRNHEEEERRRRQEEEDRRRRQEEENRQRDAMAASVLYQQQVPQYGGAYHHEGRERRGSDSDEEHHHHHHHGKHHNARKWDPNGTYSPGERVEFHGRQWVCLQGFTSNPTWTPEVAPSLWREE